MFSVYSKNKLDSLDITNSHYIKDLKKIFKEVNSSMMFNFIDDRLYVVLSCSSIFEKIPYDEYEKTIKEDIKKIICFAKDFYLDDNLFILGK